ncbi:MAG: SCP-2 sterol transfer family protein [Acidimicrobiia bacterium]|nr:MAG: SCP-2 sterol transfer family protein [Acidimicrobiia bacterium]
MSYAFLSDEWLEAVARLREESGGGDGPDVTVDVTVTGGPDGDRELHLGRGGVGPGHVGAPTKLVLPYDTARQMFVEGDQQAAMQAFMAGRIKVEGDMTKLMQLQGSGGAAADPQLLERIKALTA